MVVSVSLSAVVVVDAEREPAIELAAGDADIRITRVHADVAGWQDASYEIGGDSVLVLIEDELAVEPHPELEVVAADHAPRQQEREPAARKRAHRRIRDHGW